MKNLESVLQFGRKLWYDKENYALLETPGANE